jgi:hypothetical protein
MRETGKPTFVVLDYYWRARLRARGSAWSRGSRVVSTHGLNTQRMSVRRSEGMVVVRLHDHFTATRGLLQGHGSLCRCGFQWELGRRGVPQSRHRKVEARIHHNVCGLPSQLEIPIANRDGTLTVFKVNNFESPQHSDFA